MFQDAFVGMDTLAPLPEPGPHGIVPFDPPSFSTPSKKQVAAAVPYYKSVQPERRLSPQFCSWPPSQTCSQCQKMFSSPKDCRRHMLIHSGEKPFQCPFCPHKANLSYNLKKHIFNKHLSSATSPWHDQASSGGNEGSQHQTP